MRTLIRIVFLAFVSPLVAQAQPCNDIRSVDFRDATIRTSPTDENELTGLFNFSRGAETFNFKNGVSEEFSDEAQRKAGTPDSRSTISLDSVLTPPSGPVVRFLVVSSNHLQGTGAHSFVLGFVCRNDTIQQVFQFSTEYGPAFEINPEGQLIITQRIWAEHDPHCCPSQTRTLYYAWDTEKNRFKRFRVDGPNSVPSGQ